MAKNNQKKTQAKTVMSIDWTAQFDRLAKYAKTKYDYEVIVNESIDYGKIDFNNQEITIKQIYKKELMTYLLLHEIGHVIQTLNTKKYKRRIEEVFEVVSKSSLSFRTTVLYEEIDAWNEAYDLGKRLSVPIDRKRFETYKARCLKTYMTWVLGLNRQSRTVVQKAELQNQNDHNVHYEVVVIEEDKSEDKLTGLNQYEENTIILLGDNNNKTTD